MNIFVCVYLSALGLCHCLLFRGARDHAEDGREVGRQWGRQDLTPTYCHLKQLLKVNEPFGCHTEIIFLLHPAEFSGSTDFRRRPHCCRHTTSNVTSVVWHFSSAVQEVRFWRHCCSIRLVTQRKGQFVPAVQVECIVTD